MPPVQSSHCWQHIYLDSPGALRTRSATSAGMTGVSLPGEETFRSFGKGPKSDVYRHNATEWFELEERFGVKVTKISITKLYLAKQLAAVAADNLKGQCTKAHSCKQEAKDTLNALAQNRKGVAEAGSNEQKAVQQ